jgi:DNA-binding GntR family transcriptional regulator
MNTMAQGLQGKKPELVPQVADELHSVKRQTLADSVYVQLKTAIMRGRLRDGTELKQGELAAQLGVSRVPVREALRRLQAEHLVVAEPFQCFVVTSLSADQVMELLDLREELEVFALKRTLASDGMKQRIQAAKVAAKSLNLSQEDEDWLAADREFHRELNGATTAVAAIIEDVRERVHRYYLWAPALLQRRREVMK